MSMRSINGPYHLRTGQRVIYKLRTVQAEVAFYDLIGWLNPKHDLLGAGIVVAPPIHRGGCSYDDWGLEPLDAAVIGGKVALLVGRDCPPGARISYLLGLREKMRFRRPPLGTGIFAAILPL